MSKDIAHALSQCGYFKGLSGRSLSSLARVCRVEDVRKREHLFLEGDRGEAVFLLLSGGIQLMKSAADGREVVIKTVAPGELFAEVILFEQDAYPVNAVAIKPSTLCRVPKADFLRLLGQESFRRDFISGLLRRMRYLADRILDLTTSDVEERFFNFLEQQHGRCDEYRLTMTKKDIAAAIGATPETLSRLRERLVSQKVLQWQGKIIRLPSGFWQRRF